MSIFIDADTKLVVQGITGRDGSFHTRQMLEYGTHVVAGVTPGKGGQRFDEMVPVFITVAEAVEETAANTAVIYVPARFAADAIYEAADAGIDLVVCISEGVPVLDMTKVIPYLRERDTRLVGPGGQNGVLRAGRRQPQRDGRRDSTRCRTCSERRGLESGGGRGGLRAPRGRG